MDVYVLFWVETAVVCFLAIVIGYLLDKFKGLTLLGSITLAFSLITWGLALLVYYLLKSPVYQLIESYHVWKFPSGYLGIAHVILEIALVVYLLAGSVGYFLNKGMGTLILELSAMIAALICWGFSILPGFLLFLPSDGLIGLLLGLILVGLAGPKLFSRVVLKGKGSTPLTIVWFGFCLACGLGYGVAGRLGLLLLTCPLALFFGYWLYYLSQRLLPMREASHKEQAFKSLLTFALGTNYPYYVIDDWKTQKNANKDKPEPCVAGDPFLQFLSGPGIILNDCNHVAVTTNGSIFRVAPPGLSFTGLFEQLYAEVDLRPQLRTTTIQAETKDGIQVSIFTFAPHRIGTGGRLPALGESYPYDENAVKQAVTQQAFVGHTWARDDKGMAKEDAQRILWDNLVLLMMPPALKGVISRYTCNELHAPGDPRVRIAQEFRDQLRALMTPMGIEMVGGGISDIKPPEDVIEQRIKNWEARWKRQIEIELGEKEAEMARQLEPVWAEAQLEVMNELAEILTRFDHVAEETVAFQLVETLAQTEQITSEDRMVETLLKRRLH